MTSNLFSQLQKIPPYLLNLLRSSRDNVLGILHHIPCYVPPSRPTRTQEPKAEQIPAAPIITPPSIRPRALTAPSSPRTTSSESTPTTSSQLQSPFFNLPLEIRLLIYRHAHTLDIAHIGCLDMRPIYIRCRELDDQRPWFHRCCVTVRERDVYNGRYRYPLYDREDTKHRRSILPLIMTCRRIYTEAIPVLYQDTTFSLLQIESVVSFAAAILPQRLHTIRSVEWSCVLSYSGTRQVAPGAAARFFPQHRGDAVWDRGWSVLADMQGLTELRVDLIFVDKWVDLSAEEEWLLLRPALRVTRPRVWRLRLEWTGTGVDWAAAGAPFQVSKRLALEDRPWDVYVASCF